MPPASLLQDVLKQQLEAVEDAQRRTALLSPPDSDDDETIDVTSGAATPLAQSRTPTRSTSPVRSPRKKPLKPSSLAHSLIPTDVNNDSLIKRISTRDPLRYFPDKIRPIIFCMLSATDLAACSLVCQRWKKSQTINHAWYQIHRHETYQFSDLPVGKWTKRESKRDWRTELIKARRIRDKEESHTPLRVFSNSNSLHSNSRGGMNSRPRSGATTPLLQDGYLTPRELKEEEWARQEQLMITPDKVQSRAWYKEVGGKRVKKTKTGMTGGMRDRTAWEEE